MHFTPSMIPLSYQFYASLIIVSIFGGLSAFCLTLVALYGLGGVELVMTMAFICLFGIFRIMMPSWSAGDDYDEYFCDEVDINGLAVDSFVLQKNEEMITDCSCCPICLHTFEVGEAVSISLNCHHSYHTECLKMWLPRSPTCPYCRQDLKKKGQDISHSSDIHKRGAWGVFEGIFDSIYT
jgi:hypothetical protein